MSNRPSQSAQKHSSNNLNRQVGLYSLAAAAAGVSLLAMVQPAAGEVVVTKKTIPVPLAPRNMQEPVNISMANNGVDNFTFLLDSSSTSLRLRELLVVSVDPGKGGAHNQILAGGSFYTKALALSRGVKIGPATPLSAFFSSSGALVEGTDGTNGRNGFYYSRGYWGGSPKNKYLGVRFQLNGKTHYGWIRLTVKTNTKLNKPSLQATITGYAYETVPNKPILAGTAALATAEVQVPENVKKQPGPSIGMLAAGSEVMPLWRREESLAVA